jgi:hypothetical protein
MGLFTLNEEDTTAWRHNIYVAATNTYTPLLHMKGPGEEHVTSRFAYFQESIFKLWNHTEATYSETCYIFGPNSFFEILFVLLESTQFKAPDGSQNGNWA